MNNLVGAALALIFSVTGGGQATALRGTVYVGARPQADAVVWLESQGDVPAPSARRAVLDQRNLTFEPRVLAIRVGTTVELPNNDRVFHNVFSFHDAKRFDLGMYPAGTSRRVTFDREGLSRVFCNIHPGMAAYVMAVDSPYFAVSDRQGEFSIPSVPAGRYTYHAWRAGADIITGSATVDGEGTLDVRWP
jgi:plastocyanin